MPLTGRPKRVMRLEPPKEEPASPERRTTSLPVGLDSPQAAEGFQSVPRVCYGMSILRRHALCSHLWCARCAIHRCGGVQVVSASYIL